jgi:single-stranded DNA-specific DHH superfamily exonuclease
MSYTASLRAPEGYHLPNAMNLCQEEFDGLFDKFGGHPCAAGFSINPKNLKRAKDLMSKHLTAQSSSLAKSSDSTISIEIPEELKQYSAKKEIIWITENEIDFELLTQIDTLDPFGQDFPLPQLAFRVSNQILQNIQWLGTEKKHLKLKIANLIPLTFFNLKPDTKEFFEDEKNNQQLWVFAKMNQNAWNKQRTLELVVEKIFVI